MRSVAAARARPFGCAVRAATNEVKAVYVRLLTTYRGGLGRVRVANARALGLAISPGPGPVPVDRSGSGSGVTGGVRRGGAAPSARHGTRVAAREHVQYVTRLVEN